MKYSNMLLLLMALMGVCSVNRNLSNAITIACDHSSDPDEGMGSVTQFGAE